MSSNNSHPFVLEASVAGNRSKCGPFTHTLHSSEIWLLDGSWEEVTKVEISDWQAAVTYFGFGVSQNIESPAEAVGVLNSASSGELEGKKHTTCNPSSVRVLVGAFKSMEHFERL